MEGEPTEHSVEKPVAKSTARDLLFWSICVGVVLFLLLFLLSFAAPLVAVWTLATGWLTYSFKVIPQLSFNGELWACGTVALALSLLIGHRFFRWLTNHHPMLPSPFPFKTTLSLIALVLFLFGASIAMTGIVHQGAWLLRSKWFASDMSTRTTMIENIRNARQLKLSLDNYASDHQKFPESLQQLVDDEFSAKQLHILQWRNSGSPPEPWLYLGGGRSYHESEGSLPILVQPRLEQNGTLIVMTIDSSVRAVRWKNVPPEIRELLVP